MLTKKAIAARIRALPEDQQAIAASMAVTLYGIADNKTAEQAALESKWTYWLQLLFPKYFSRPFGRHHSEFWEWVWTVRLGIRSTPYVAIWPRGHGKSTNFEAACSAFGARGTRRYGWYISEKQDQADDHVQNVADMLESQTINQHYPQLGQRLVNKFGSSKGWKRNRIRTSTGFTVDAMGLDVAKRGVKLEQQRPDFMIFDDIDGKNDSPQMTAKKIGIITHSILAAGSHDCTVLAGQNLIHKDGFFSQLADGREDCLIDRNDCTPVPALRRFDYHKEGRRTVISGEPTWEGMDLAACQELVDNEGFRAFLTERQHRVELNLPGAIFPEWNEIFHVITESEFKRAYGPVSWTDPDNQRSPYMIPHNAILGRGLDWGTTPGHLTAAMFAAKMHPTMALSDAVFIYREITRPEFPCKEGAAEPVSPRRVKKALMKATRKWNEEARMEVSAMSHEASAAYNTFLEMMDDEDQLWFSKWKAQKGSGEGQIQNALEIDETLDHPFRRYPKDFPDRALAGKALKGCPGFFVIVPDNQGELYCDKEGILRVKPAINSSGMARLRYEVPKYRNPLTAAGKERQNPKANGEDDAIDALKGLANLFFPVRARLSKEQRIDALLPKPLTLAKIQARRVAGEDVQGAVSHRLAAVKKIENRLAKKKVYSPLAAYRQRLKQGK